MITVIHLVDDEKPGGVTRLLTHLKTDPGLGRLARHEVVPVKRGRFSPPSVAGDVIVSHLSVCWRNFPLFVALRARYANAPLIHIEHSYSHGFLRHNVKRAGRFRALLKSSYALFDRVVGVSEGQALWLRDFGAAPAEKLRIIPSCVALAPFLGLAPRKRDGRLIIGAIGRLDRQKGFDTLIRAVKRLADRDVRLRIWGDGPEAASLKALIGGAAHIELMGPTDRPATAYEMSDIVAVPSRWEPYGLVCLEARAAARPVIVADCDGLPEQIREGGVLVRGETPDDWAEAIAGLIEEDLGPIRDLARFSAESAEGRYIAAWRALLEEVTAAGFASDAAAA